MTRVPQPFHSSRCRTAGVVALGVVLVALGVGTASARAQVPAAGESPERVILFSIPRTTWAMLEHRELPNLKRVLAGGAAANLSTRSATARSSLENGYATLGAGNRADAGTLGAAAFNRNEEVDNSTACQTYQRRVGAACNGEIVHLGIVDADRRNEALLYDARVGALGSALQDAGLNTGVFANADGPVLTDQSRREVADQPPFEPGATESELPTELAQAPTVQLGRSAALAVMNTAGVVELGTVSEKSLLADDPGFPYGVRLSVTKTMERVDQATTAPELLVIEASDLERVDRARGLATAEQHEVLLDRAFENTDDLLGEILARAPLERNLYLIVSPAPPRGVGELTVFAMAGPGVEPGLATSASTRRPGFVQLMDVAPTILDRLGLEIPAPMTGKAITSAGGKWTYGEFVAANRESIVGEQMRKPAFLGFVVVLALLYIVAALYFWRHDSSRVLAFLAVWCLYVPLAMFLIILLPFSAWATGVNMVVTGLIALGLALLTWPMRRVSTVAPLAVSLSVTLAVILLDLLTGSNLQLDSVLGYSPIVAGRFTGTGNLGWALMVTCAILLAGLAVQTWTSRRAALTFTAILFLVVVVIDGAPMWGADIGGILTTVPGFAVAFLLLSGRRIRPGPVLVAGIATVVAVGVFAAIDLARPEDAQTHLAGTIHTFLDGGWDALWMIIRRKIDANLSIVRRSSFAIVVPISAAFLVALWLQRPGLPRIIERWPFLRASLWSLLVTGVLGAFSNDSGIAILAMMLGLVVPMLLYLRAAEDYGVEVDTRDADAATFPSGDTEREPDGAVLPRAVPT
ncbi:MAG: hypothetical protein IT198_13270 [Acidimicrobiia bacterium]|nr:hypothetical protein [Acidimicrobiia bacterium]